MPSTCAMCSTLALRTPAIDLRASLNHKGGSFGSLRLGTRFSLFACPQCATHWKWSLLRGWHHDGQRYAPPAVLGMRLPMPQARAQRAAVAVAM